VRTVLLDTVGLIALWDSGDQWHAAASAAMSEIIKRPVKLIATSWIMVECANTVARKSHRLNAPMFRDELRRSGNLIEPTPEEIETAWTAYRDDKTSKASIVDHVSFVVMRREGIFEALTNDHHFKTAGFVTLF
jgi:predicted nucleic acid-binding protein